MDQAGGRAEKDSQYTAENITKKPSVLVMLLGLGSNGLGGKFG
jgi:hypothetical protein